MPISESWFVWRYAMDIDFYQDKALLLSTDSKTMGATNLYSVGPVECKCAALRALQGATIVNGAQKVAPFFGAGTDRHARPFSFNPSMSASGADNRLPWEIGMGSAKMLYCNDSMEPRGIRRR